jgi:hypothetical protein
MPTLADLVYVALFAVIVPLVDYLVFWPRLLRTLKANPARGRRWLYALGMSAWVILGSLWPAIVLHFLLDLAGGIMAWLALRDEPVGADVNVEPQPTSF